MHFLFFQGQKQNKKAWYILNIIPFIEAIHLNEDLGIDLDVFSDNLY